MGISLSIPARALIEVLAPSSLPREEEAARCSPQLLHEVDAGAVAVEVDSTSQPHLGISMKQQQIA